MQKSSSPMLCFRCLAMVEGFAYPRLASVGYPLSKLPSSCVAACPSGAKRLCVLVPTSQAGKDSRVDRTTAGAACNRRLPPTVVNSVMCPVGVGVAAAGLCPPRLPPPDRQRASGRFPAPRGEPGGVSVALPPSPAVAGAALVAAPAPVGYGNLPAAQSPCCFSMRRKKKCVRSASVGALR